MKCLKCGNDTTLDRVFCDECILIMEKYPVSPSTPVILPKRTDSSAVRKTQRKKAPSPEEQIVVLKGRIRLLIILLTAMTILCALLVYPAVRYLMDDHFIPGQNYTSIVSKTSVVADSN